VWGVVSVWPPSVDGLAAGVGVERGAAARAAAAHFGILRMPPAPADSQAARARGPMTGAEFQTSPASRLAGPSSLFTLSDAFLFTY